MTRLPYYEGHELRELAREAAPSLSELSDEQFEELAKMFDGVVRDNERGLMAFIRVMLRGVETGADALEAVEMLRDAISRAEQDDGTGIQAKEVPLAHSGVKGALEDALHSDLSDEDIDDTFGKGMAELARQESRSVDGGAFQPGGLTQGGIFGDAPIATKFTDPGARQRSALAKAQNDRAVRQRQDAELSASEKRRQRLLGDKESDT
ncbi:MAG: hypothetical protein GWN84_13255 [Gammaproteobacteria bacterium]|nr:hypothetical protein [Gammaproteobacteria bacterium]NIR83797.1 hypothetical protein [Gammaproteobacteria bacterium]NIU05123.1 hypothetical protein [Gammaproteobacteria bacterium]NIV51960.1 hypothetical protein [Gammaproteobacteria bacterium]NIX86396.1 hypothetical protein [Gammaproteobacteria bacterium]